MILLWGGVWIQGSRASEINLGHVCLPKSSFREITFQTFMCLFAIRKVGQQKTLSSQKNFGLVSRKVFFLLAVFVFRKDFHVFVCH